MHSHALRLQLWWAFLSLPSSQSGALARRGRFYQIWIWPPRRKAGGDASILWRTTMWVLQHLAPQNSPHHQQWVSIARTVFCLQSHVEMCCILYKVRKLQLYNSSRVTHHEGGIDKICMMYHISRSKCATCTQGQCWKLGKWFFLCGSLAHVQQPSWRFPSPHQELPRYWKAQINERFLSLKCCLLIMSLPFMECMTMRGRSQKYYMK